MSYWLNTLINNIKIIDLGSKYDVTGIRTWLFTREVARQFGTVRINNGMFTSVTGTSLQFNKFFIYDFYEIVKYLVENSDGLIMRIEILRKLLEELDKLPEIVRSKKTFKSILDRSALSRFKFPPLPKQEEFFSEYDQNKQKYALNGYILATPPGSGKTYSSLMLMAMRKCDTVFVFSPNNALNEVWAETLSVVDGADTCVYPKVPERFDYTHYVFSHENTKMAVKTIASIMKNSRSKKIGIIIDECHRFTELASDLTNNLIDICRAVKSEDILFMSGTPFKAIGREILPFLMSTDPLFTGKAVDGFKKIAAASSSAARQILAARIGRTLYRVDKLSIVDNKATEYVVKVEVPDGTRFTLRAIQEKMKAFIKERTTYYMKEGPALVAEYHRIVDVFSKTPEGRKNPAALADYKRTAAKIRETRNLMDIPEEIKQSNSYERLVIIPALSPADKIIFRNVKSVYKYLPLKIRGEALGRILGNERVKCNVALMENIDKGRIYSDAAGFNGDEWTIDDIFSVSKSKVVMFSDYIEVLGVADKVLRKKGYNPELVYGETNSNLSSIIKRFKDDPKINPVVATYKSLSTAVPLVMADTCVLLNAPFRDYIKQQATSRVDRLGQPHPVHIYTYRLYTGGEENISTRSSDILEWSKKMVDELLGITSPDDADDVNEEVADRIATAESRGWVPPVSIVSNW